MLDYFSAEIALTGQLEMISSQLQSAQSSDITFAFPPSILNTFGQSASHVPQPMQRSSFTDALDINF